MTISTTNSGIRSGIRLAAVDGVAVEEASSAKASPAKSAKPLSPPTGAIHLRGRGKNDKKLVAALKGMGDQRLLDMLIGLRTDLAQFEREVERRRAATRPKPKPYEGPRLLVLAEEAARFEKGTVLVTEEGLPFLFTGYGRAWPGSAKYAQITGRPEMASQRVCYAYGTVISTAPHP